jgi:chromate transporter
MAEADLRAIAPAAEQGGAGEVFLAFLKLGLTSFGGPIAHLGYFRSAFVARRGWMSERAFADLVALAQFLPGPASSQVGFAIGLTRAGWLGGLAAWTGFTLPSAALMLAFAYGAVGIADSWQGAGVLHGLKLMAVAVIAQAVLGMARTFCADAQRATIAIAALALVSFVPGSLAQLAAIVVGGLAGLAAVRSGEREAADDFAPHLSRRAALVALALFLALLALSFAPAGEGLAALAAAFYRSGALVFGGGHVVLPLLRDALVAPGFLSQGRRCPDPCSPSRPDSARSPVRRRPASRAASSH